MALKILAAFLLGFLSFSPTDVTETQAGLCSNIDEVDERLFVSYGEVRSQVALSSNGDLLMVYATETGSTWTLVAVRPNGCVGLVLAGEWWQAIVPGESL